MSLNLLEPTRDHPYLSIINGFLLALSAGQRLMHRLLCFQSKCPNHFEFTLVPAILVSSLFNVDVNCSCSLKCIEKNTVNCSYFGSC